MRARDFLRTLVIRRLGTFIMAEGRPRSHKRRVFPYMGDVEFNALGSRALLSLLDGHWCVIGSLDVAYKLSPYRDL